MIFPLVLFFFSSLYARFIRSSEKNIELEVLIALHHQTRFHFLSILLFFFLLLLLKQAQFEINLVGCVYNFRFINCAFRSSKSTIKHFARCESEKIFFSKINNNLILFWAPFLFWVLSLLKKSRISLWNSHDAICHAIPSIFKRRLNELCLLIFFVANDFCSQCSKAHRLDF